MRILFLNHNVAGKGTYQRCIHFARALVRRGHAVTLVTTSRTARLEACWRMDGGVRVLEAPDLLWGPGRTGWDPCNALRRVVALREESFDLVHAFDCRPAVILPALAVQRRTGAALFIDWADWWGRGGRIQERSGWLVRTAFGPVETWFEEAFRGRALGTTVASAALARRSESLGIEPEQILMLSNGCDSTMITPIARREARANLGIRGTEPLLAYLGTATAGEMALACDTLRLLRAGGSGACLVFLGEPNVPVPPELLANGAVRLTGFIPFAQLRMWLGAADLCLIPMPDTLGNRGRWPGKINDYLSAGRPVLMTAVGDAAALVKRTGAGWTAPPQAEAMAAAAERALSDEPALRRAGGAARALAERELSWDRLAGSLDAFYAERLAG
jgi:glycosyltransferase involved in cell wall biosynthesis